MISAIAAVSGAADESASTRVPALAGCRSSVCEEKHLLLLRSACIVASQEARSGGQYLSTSLMRIVGRLDSAPRRLCSLEQVRA